MGTSQSQPLRSDAEGTDRELSARLTSVIKDLDHFYIHLRRLRPKKDGVIGAGGYGEVYVATLDKSSPNQREVAVKNLRTPWRKRDDKHLALRLARELKIWANLQHPNILKLLGFYLSDDYQVARLISVYMVNGNVSLYIAQKQPDIATRLKFVQGITAGVKYLHDFVPPIVHGDLKPANVLISDSLDATLCDFGVASFINSGNPPSGLTTTDTLKGSLRYMSPELILGYEVKHTLQSDIWAWACTTYEILTDIEPFQEAKIAGTIMREIVLENTPGSLGVLLAQLPQNERWSTNLSESIINCWDYTPSKRPSVAMIIRDCGFLSKVVAESFVIQEYKAGGPKTRSLVAPQALEILRFLDRKASSNYLSLLSGWTLLTRLRWEPPRWEPPQVGTEPPPAVIPSPQPVSIWRLSSIFQRCPFSADGRAVQWPSNLLNYKGLVKNRFTAALGKKWNAFFGGARTIQATLSERRPRKKMIVITVSQYHDRWPALNGPSNDWKFWAMLSRMAGWNVEIVADSLPTVDPTRYPSKENILRYIQALVKDNREGDQFVIVYSGHGDNQGLVLADGSHISHQELRTWLVQPLNSGSTLWGFFDCCESSNILGLPHKILCDENQSIRYQPAWSHARHGDEDLQGSVISIGSAAGLSAEMDLTDPSVPTPGQFVRCGPLAWAAYRFFCFELTEGEPLLSRFWPTLMDGSGCHPKEGPQVTASTIIRDPLLPMLRPLPMIAPSV